VIVYCWLIYKQRAKCSSVFTAAWNLSLPPPYRPPPAPSFSWLFRLAPLQRDLIVFKIRSSICLSQVRVQIPSLVYSGSFVIDLQIMAVLKVNAILRVCLRYLCIILLVELSKTAQTSMRMQIFVPIAYTEWGDAVASTLLLYQLINICLSLLVVLVSMCSSISNISKNIVWAYPCLSVCLSRYS
jgi:hypothetical protein